MTELEKQSQHKINSVS